MRLFYPQIFFTIGRNIPKSNAICVFKKDVTGENIDFRLSVFWNFPRDFSVLTTWVYSEKTIHYFKLYSSEKNRLDQLLQIECPLLMTIHVSSVRQLLFLIDHAANKQQVLSTWSNCPINFILGTTIQKLFWNIIAEKIKTGTSNLLLMQLLLFQSQISEFWCGVFRIWHQFRHKAFCNIFCISRAHTLGFWVVCTHSTATFCCSLSEFCRDFSRFA